ncbi:MAG TPA: CHRD domain-containing protein [Nitrososphaeraceae archaeon]
MKTSIFTAKIHTIAIALSMTLFAMSLSPSVQAQEQGGDGFTADLSGQNEVPPTESNATGTAEILFNNDSSEASYFVNTTGFEEITAAHIHDGSEGENGEIVVPLSQEASAENQDDPAIWFSGEISNDDLQGPLQGMEIPDLASLINNGSAYVNVHTEENPDGAIRGQLATGDVEMDHFSQPNGDDGDTGNGDGDTGNENTGNENQDNGN